MYSGGSHENVADITHPDNLALAVRAARIAGLDVAGVDFLTADISRSWLTGVGAICEINGQPALSPHQIAEPDRDIYGDILDVLFEGRPARIPTTAVIGPGAADVVRLVHRMFNANGSVAGRCGREGIQIGSEWVSTADQTGVHGLRALLIDPAVEAAAIELSAQKLAREGHPCDRYDVAVLTGGAACAEDSPAVIARTALAVVRPADDPEPGIGDVLVDFSDADSNAQQRVVTVADGRVVFRARGESDAVADWDGTSHVLYAAAAGWAHGLDIDAIARVLNEDGVAAPGRAQRR